MNLLLPALLVVATITGAGMILPQVLRVRKTKSLHGLSAAWIGVGLAMNLWWTAYAFAGNLWGLLPVSVLGFAFYAELARQFIRIRGSRSISLLARGGLSLGLVPIPFLVAAGWPGAGLAIGLCYGIQFLPAAAEAMRSAQVDGISPATWVMAWIEAVIWLVYGSSVGDPALLVGGGGGTLMASVILVRLLIVGRARPTQHAPVALAA